MAVSVVSLYLWTMCSASELGYEIGVRKGGCTSKRCSSRSYIVLQH